MYPGLLLLHQVCVRCGNWAGRRLANFFLPWTPTFKRSWVLSQDGHGVVGFGECMWACGCSRALSIFKEELSPSHTKKSITPKSGTSINPNNTIWGWIICPLWRRANYSPDKWEKFPNLTLLSGRVWIWTQILLFLQCDYHWRETASPDSGLFLISLPPCLQFFLSALACSRLGPAFLPCRQFEWVRKKPRSHVQYWQVFKGFPVAIERAAAKGKSAPFFKISFPQTNHSENLSGLGPTAFLAQPVLIREGPLGLHQSLLTEEPRASLLSIHFETQPWPSFANEKGGSLGGARVLNSNEAAG